MLAEFSVYPMDAAHISKDVARMVEILESSGLEYRLGPMGTSVEGDWPAVMQVIQRCHQAAVQGHARVITNIVIDDRKEGGHHLDEMIASVEEHLGHRAKH